MTGPAKGFVLGVYDRHGATWARLRGEQAAERVWLDRFCDLLPEGAAVLDIGCGSGVPIANTLVGRGFDVTGVDGSATMLDLFRRNLPGSPAILSDMRQLALERHFAGLVAWDSFFHLSPDDQRTMFARFRVHAAPGAALLFTSGESEGSAVGKLADEPLYHGSLEPENIGPCWRRSGSKWWIMLCGAQAATARSGSRGSTDEALATTASGVGPPLFRVLLVPHDAGSATSSLRSACRTGRIRPLD